MKTTALVAFGLLSLLTAVYADNWPMWRGPLGDGTTAESGLPQKWSREDHVLWKTPLPGPGNSTPIVWGDKVFLTQAIEKTGQRLLLCLDRQTGKQLWESGTLYREPELTHATNPYCSGSPATDGELIIVFFGSAGIFCYDMQGKEIWKRTDLGRLHHIWGSGTSPVIAGDRFFLNFGPGEKTTLYAFDKATGKTLWQHEEPGGASGEEKGKKWLGSWADPLLRHTGARDELFMSYPGRVCSFDPLTGKPWWTCAGLNPLVYNSPLYADGHVIAFGGYNGMGLSVRAGGSGDVTQSHRVWHLPKVSQRIGTGIIRDGHHYILTDGGIAECRDLKDGKIVWSERLKGPGPRGQNWSSLVLTADAFCYAINQGGDAFVFRASPQFELLATNSLGEKVIGSIAVSDGHLFIRSYEHLWCIGR
ncbi:outer membrane protein assembly factor BamB [Prosthecobacter fusiformis]|uniref:Outer membrane protein assembly factor BamB n=1 Tax=Prosthecobacter fusiformis TaxID=48464 RepID=A0A4R7RKL1_9BACT|nr:PQQ-binding-like beta-propeller repeat protein [Prosthecobacter fusiformis]TDU64256.1 outer membrane protein assembly factor BamB [Prosthecobacter fusiformis]